jgi:hypothetical protein
MELLSLGPLKSFIPQPLPNAHFLGPGGCGMKDFNGSEFAFLKRKLCKIQDYHLSA